MSQQWPEPKWAKILDILYDRDKELDKIFENDQEKIRYLLEKLDLDKNQIENTVQYMSDVGLVECYGEDTFIPFKLSSKGFDVAHERELDRAQDDRVTKQHKQQLSISRQQAELNGILTGLTVVLAGSALIQAVASLPLISGHQVIHWSLLIVAIILAVFTLGIVLYPTKWQEYVSKSK